MLRFGLVSFPVQGFTTKAPEGARIAFNQLHRECHSRIRYIKECPIHGPVTKDDIVSGYEYGKGQYVEIEPAELDEFRSERERALTIDNFIAADEIDPLYLDGRSYFLAPDGADAREPYTVFLQALERKKRYGIGQVVISSREQAVLVRPYGSVLVMEMLYYATELREPGPLVGAIPTIRALDKKLRLAEQVIAHWSEEKFDYAEYVDHYQEKVRSLIEAKVAGRELVTPEVDEEPEVVNLMDALRRSVHRGNGKRASTRSAPRPKRTTARHRAAKRRKAS
jgi:DNA end-binding protein Ku